MSWLDKLFAGYKTVQASGASAPQESTLNFADATYTDANGVTTIQVTGGTPAGSAGGDLDGTYPGPTVQNLTGNGSGELDATAHTVQWLPNATPNAGTFSWILQIDSNDDGPEVALVFPSSVNSQHRWDCVVTATKAGDSSSGVGSLCTSWVASAAFTRRSGAAVKLFDDIGDAKGDAAGFTGPTFSPSSTNELLIVDPGGDTTGTVHWVINLTITAWGT